MAEDDVDLFARLLAAHQDKLYRVAYRMTGHPEDAQDLLQDALLEAYRSFKKFQRGTYFDKWLYRIMTNTFIDRQRHRKRVGRVESLDAPLTGEEGEAGPRDIPDWSTTRPSAPCATLTASRSRRRWTAFRRNSAWFWSCRMWKSSRTKKSRR